MDHLQLETQRLLLRRFTPQDAPALFLLLKDQQANTFLPWFPHETLEQTRQWMRGSGACQDGGVKLAICLKSDGIPIGYIQVSGGESHDLGYALRPPFWHMGIASEAGLAMVELMKARRVSYLTATHDVNNPRSGQVMQRIGMKYQYSYVERCQPKDMLVTFRLYQINLDGDPDRVYWGYWNQYPQHFIEKDVPGLTTHEA